MTKGSPHQAGIDAVVAEGCSETDACDFIAAYLRTLLTDPRVKEEMAIAICPWFNGTKDDRTAQEVWDDMFERYKAAYREQTQAALDTLARMAEGGGN